LASSLKCYDCSSQVDSGCGKALTSSITTADCGSGVLACLKLVNKTSYGTYYTRSCSPSYRGLCNTQYCNTGSAMFELYSCNGDACNNATLQQSTRLVVLLLALLPLMMIFKI
jgi:hypothetical protein